MYTIDKNGQSFKSSWFDWLIFYVELLRNTAVDPSLIIAHQVFILLTQNELYRSCYAYFIACYDSVIVRCIALCQAD